MSTLKKLITLLLITASIFTNTSAFAENAEVLDTLILSAPSTNVVRIYVSDSDGNDGAEGNIDSPVKTVQEAKKRAQNIDKSTTKVEIIIRGGNYRFLEPMRFDAEDSGTKENPVVYKAYEGEKVYFKASVPLDMTKAERITDDATLKRIKDDIEDKVFVLDLAAQGYPKDKLFKPYVCGMYGMDQSNDEEMNYIYFDGEEQMFASFPNDRAYAYWEKTVDDRTIQIKENNIDNWTDVRSAWMQSFYQYDYSTCRHSLSSVDAESKTITVIPNAGVEMKGYYSKRWRVYNILEEMDIPGEFFLDYYNEKLYFFPPKYISDSTLEMSVGTNIINGQNLKNVYFEGIEFSQTRSTAVKLKDIDNIDFYNCRFIDIGTRGIYVSGSTPAVAEGSHWQKTQKHGSYNMNIKGCDFVNTGATAVRLTGSGDVDTITPSNNVIEDCFFHRVSNRSFWDSIWLGGCGDEVKNCLFSNNPHQAVRMAGSELRINHNEIHDILRENDDAGAIYGGMHAIWRGWDVSYNYIHDLKSIQTMTYNATLGIYNDDGQEGNYDHHNILVNMKTGINSNHAAAIDLKYNTFVDVRYPFNLIANANRDTAVSNYVSFYLDDFDKALADIPDKDLFFSRYPELKKHLIDKVNPKHFTDAVDNFATNLEMYKVSEQDARFATVERNVEATGYDMFVDPENQDYRLKADSIYAIQNPELLSEANFDLDTIGLQREMKFDSEHSPFYLTYPQNGQKAVNSAEVRFAWQKAFGADKYRLVVAEDSEFKNVVVDELVYNSTQNISTLSANKVYYWKVYAINNSRKFGNEWENIGGISVFSTAIYNNPDKTALVKAVAEVRNSIETTNESNLAGEYKMGVKKKLTAYLDLLEFITIKAPRALTSAAKVEYYKDIILDLYNNKDNLNPGFLDVGRYITAKNWTGYTEIKDGEKVVLNAPEGGNFFAGTDAMKLTTGRTIMCFDIQIDGTKDGDWLAIGNNTNYGLHTYLGKNTGFHLIFKNNLVELQRADGSKNELLATYDKKNFCDGKRHTMKFGRIDLGYLNVAYVEIDGEVIFNHPDLAALNITADGALAIQVFSGGNKVTLYASENIPEDEESFKKVKYEILKGAAKGLYNQYSDFYTNIRILNPDSKTLLTSTGAKRLDVAPYEVSGSDAYASTSTVDAIFGVQGTVANGNYTVSVDGVSATAPVKMVDGIATVSLEQICSQLGMIYQYDSTYSRCILIADAGGENLPNLGPRLNRSMNILKDLDEYEAFDF